jgi:superfamily II DNA or RNA helicase
MILGKTWDSEKATAELYQSQLESFDRLWNDQELDVRVHSLSNALKADILKIHRGENPPKAPQGLLEESEAESYKEEKFSIPLALEWNSGRYAHQGEAVEAWEKNGRKGILSIATGGGKTITALICAHRLYSKLGSLHILIAVPTRVLAEQWKHECHSFGLTTVEIDLGSSVKERIAQISDNIDAVRLGISSVEVSILLNNTLADVKFQDCMSRAGIDQLLIADECHNLGSERLIESLPKVVSYRLGLSATPVRQYDAEGTESLLEYFDGSVYDFGLSQAIGICLVPYEYYIHTAYLNEDESREVSRLSKRISLLNAMKEGRSHAQNEELKMLQMRRGRIVESAQDKLIVFENMFFKLPEEQRRLSIIFCTSKETSQLEQVQSILNKNRCKYRRVTQAESGSRRMLNSIIKDFRERKIDILVAKRVLDEGANIPEIENAFFLGSTTTEREWIQRRGRVLRKSQGKLMARIHDFICLPHPDYVDMCRAVYQRELKRCLEFSDYSCNRLDADGGRMCLERLRSRYSF